MKSESESEAQPLQARLVLLGASNLARTFATATTLAQAHIEPAIDLMAAPGHGRSYGSETTVMGRRLPSLLGCALWNDLENREPLPTSAVIMDIGNDLIYGTRVEELIDWLVECVKRLRKHDAEVVIAKPPLAVFELVSPWRFNFFRNLMFRSSRMEFADGLNQARQLDSFLDEMAKEEGVTAIEQPSDWYGWDPVHILRNRSVDTWRTIYNAFPQSEDVQSPPRVRYTDFFYLRSRIPHERHLYGVAQRRQQPVAKLPKKGCLSLY